MQHTGVIRMILPFEFLSLIISLLGKPDILFMNSSYECRDSQVLPEINFMDQFLRFRLLLGDS